MPLSPQQLSILNRSRRDPSWWVKNILGKHPWTIQRSIMHSVLNNAETSVASCHGIGKSFSAAAIALWFLYNYPYSLVITTAGTDRQVKEIIWREIASLHAYANSRHPNILEGAPLTQQLVIPTEGRKKWMAIGFTAPKDDSDKFHGHHADHVLVIVDEASAVSDQIYEGIGGILASGTTTRLLNIGNPIDPFSHFAKTFTYSDVTTFNISCFDTPNFTKFGLTKKDFEDNTWQDKIGQRPLPRPYLISPAYVAKLYNRYRSWDHPIILVRALGKFPDSNTDSLVPMRHIQTAMTRESSITLPIHWGIDVGRGGDNSVIFERRGTYGHVLATSCFRDTMRTAGWIKRHYEEAERRPTEIKIEITGIGAGVYDRCAELSLPVLAADPASKAIEDEDTEEFLNARAQWHWDLKNRFEEGWITLSDDDKTMPILEQSQHIKYKTTSAGKIQIIDKKQIIKELGESPNEWDAMCIAFAKCEEEFYIL